MYAVDHLNMTVPVGAIYGFIGENGSGKSTTMKLICGHLIPDYGGIKLFGKDYTDPGVRVRVGALIENAGCFPGSSVYQNLKMQCINLGIENADEEVHRVLEIVRMEDNANIKFKSCSLGMKQRIGIAMALLGDPALLILDEPINGLDTDGMRMMREILVDITQKYGCTVLISSHILGELEKIATHYGIIRQGVSDACVCIHLYTHQRCSKAEGMACNLRKPRRWDAALYDGIYDYPSWLYIYKRYSLPRRWYIICCRSRCCRQSGFEKNKSCIRNKATSFRRCLFP